MFKLDNRGNVIVISTVVGSLIAVVLRCLLTVFNFDYNTLFFVQKLPATILYFAVLLFAAAVFFASKKIAVCDIKPSKIHKILDLLTLVIFITLFINRLRTPADALGIANALRYVSIVSLLISSLYFALAVFFNKSSLNALIGFLNIFPVIFFAVELMDGFIGMSSKANTYHLLPNILSLLVIAFFIINEAKQKIGPDKDSPVYLCSHSALTFIILAFSALPDLFIALTSGNSIAKMSFEEILFLILKFIYIVHSADMFVKTLVRYNEVQK